MNSKKGTLLKFVVFSLNGAFLFFGLLLLIFGGLVYSGAGRFHDITPLSPCILIVLLVLGLSVTLISFLGSCGALLEKYSLLIAFSSLVGLAIIGQLVALGLLYNYKSQLGSLTTDSFIHQIHQYTTCNSSRLLVDRVQTQLGCCGAISFMDYPLGDYPRSCCIGNRVDKCTDPSQIPCPVAIQKIVTENLDILAIIVGLFLSLQTTSLFLSLSMARNTRIDYYRFV